MKNQKKTLEEITRELMYGERSKNSLLSIIQENREFVQIISTQDICTMKIEVSYYTQDLHERKKEISLNSCSDGKINPVTDVIRAYLLTEVNELSTAYQALIEKENQLSEQLLKDISKEIKADSGNA